MSENIENEPVMMLYSDIQKKMALSIKLAAEDFIVNSIRGIRIALDFLTGAVFFLTSCVGGKPDADDINSFYDSYTSGLWSGLKEFDINEMTLSNIFLRTNGKEVDLTQYPENTAKSLTQSMLMI